MNACRCKTLWRSAVHATWLAAAMTAPLAAQEAKPLVRDVSGTVQGAAGEKVRVTIWHNDLSSGSVDAAGELAAADGAFAFRAVPWFEKQQWGSHSFLVVARTDKRVAALTIRGDQAPRDGLRLELVEATEVRGVLRSKEAGKPLADVTVWARIFGDPRKGQTIWLASSLPLWSAVSDGEGRFTLKGLPPIAPLVLMAGNADYASTSIQVADSKEVVEAELPLAGKVRGTVVLPDGKPAVRVRVRTTGQHASYSETMTGDDGTFCLAGLPSDVYKVWAEAPDLTVMAVVGLTVGAGDVIEDQRVQLVKGGFIVGRIVDQATGAPFVPGAHTDVAMYGPARGDGGSCEATPVLADGTFRIRAPAGRNRIYLRAAEGWSEPSEYVEVVEGEETKVEWRLTKGALRK